MKKLAESHLDHGLSDAQVAYIFERFADRGAFFIETFGLPEALGTVPCGLYGPLMGDDPVIEDAAGRGAWDVPGRRLMLRHEPRGTRTWPSRLMPRWWPMRPTRKVTVIAGPHEGYPCILYTAFGGPATPREPGDIRQEIKALEMKRIFEREQAMARCEAYSDDSNPTYAKIVDLRAKRVESDAFWAEHALAQQ